MCTVGFKGEYCDIGKCLPSTNNAACIGSIKTLVCDERDRVITYVFCRDLFYATLRFSGLYKNICLKESKDWRNISNKIIVTLVTQGLPSSSSEIISNAYIAHF